jgi:hypothetical protein
VYKGSSSPQPWSPTNAEKRGEAKKDGVLNFFIKSLELSFHPVWMMAYLFSIVGHFFLRYILKANGIY